MDERKWNVLMSEINQQEQVLQQLRVSFGWEKEETGKAAEADGSRESPSVAGKSRIGISSGQTKDAGFHSVRTSQGKTEASNRHGGGTISIAPGIPNHGEKIGNYLDRADVPAVGSRARSNFQDKMRLSADKEADGKWDASSMLIEEIVDSVTDEDLQLYQIRKRYLGMPPDEKMEQMEHQVPTLVSEWDDPDMATDLHPEGMFLKIGTYLSKGQITDMAQQEMLLLSGTEKAGDPGMKQFYSVFTLLQGSPSRSRIANVLAKAGQIPSGKAVGSSIRILAEAIRNAVAEQDARDISQDRHYRSRQAGYDKIHEKVKKDYDDAKRRTDRWRK